MQVQLLKLKLNSCQLNLDGARNISVAEIVIGDQSGVAILELIDGKLATI